MTDANGRQGDSEWTPERWRRLEDAFHEIDGAPQAAREQLLERLAEEDRALANEVREMLDAHESENTGALERRLVAEQSGPSSLGIHDAAIEDRLVGSRVGAYRLLRFLGAGGMGRVYLAERREADFRQEVAIKFLPAESAASEVVERFRLERQVLARLQHPNIATLLDGGLTDAGAPYIVMQVVEGRPLTRYCDEEQLTIAQRLQIFRTVCRTVQYAHANLVVHRDLKPSNILVTDDGEVKLLDFGIAKLLDPGALDMTSGLTRTGSRLLTPLHAAPEQILGEPITTATDVYGLGILLYELLTGVSPWSSVGDQRELARAVTTKTPPRPTSRIDEIEGKAEIERLAGLRRTTPARLRRQLRGDLERIVLMALRKEPERRYASAGELGEDLRRWASGEAVLAHSESVGYRLRRFVARNRIAVATAASIAALILSFAIFAARQASDLRIERDELSREKERSEAVITSLVDLFRTAMPDQAQGETVPIGEFIQSIEAKAEELADRPDIQARLLFALGEIYAVRGSAVRAREFFERAWTMEQELGQQDTPHARAVLHSLALQDRYTGRLELARSRFRESARWHREYWGPVHADVAQAMTDLASVLSPQEALPVLQEATEIQRQLEPEGSIGYASSLNAMANHYVAVGNRAAAYGAFEETLEILASSLEADHPHRLVVELNLVAVSEDPLERLQGVGSLLPRLERVHGRASRRVASALVTQGHAHLELGDFGAARRSFLDAEAVALEAVGESGAATALAVAGLARILDLELDHRGAAALYERAISGLEGRHSRTRALGQWSTVLARLGQHELAAEKALEGFALLDDSPTVDADEATSNYGMNGHLHRARYGQALLAAGKLDEAREQLAAAHHALAGLDEVPHGERLTLELALGRALTATDFQGAKGLLARAIPAANGVATVDRTELRLAREALATASD